jgi:hypothetical protein
MKPYGVIVANCPDVLDIQDMGAKSSEGKYRERGGDFKSYIRSANKRSRIRRYWKRVARAAGKRQCEAGNWD